MYHALLCNRYLTSRVIPFIAVAAVAMCVALVIVVVSVMTGFLNMVRNSGRTLMGDVIVSYPVTGIPYYDEFIERVEALPEVEAATPVVENWGLLKMPYPFGPSKANAQVQIWGIEPASFARVTGYSTSLYWDALTEPQLRQALDRAIDACYAELGPTISDAQRATFRAMVDPTFEQWRSALTASQWDLVVKTDPRLADAARLRQDGLTLTRNGRPAMVPGIAVAGTNVRDRTGRYVPTSSQKDSDVEGGTDWYWFMPFKEVTLTAIPVDRGGGLPQPESFIFPIANEFQSGVYVIDSRRVLIPIEIAQEILNLDRAVRVSETEFDESGMPLVLGEDPATATQVLVRARDGVAPADLAPKITALYDAFRDARIRLGDPTMEIPPARGFGVSIQTWEEYQAEFIGPVEKERELMRTLFSLVYLVCAGLVLAIFWAIVYEKTRDIGILRSFGASRIGVAWIFLRYGLVVGTLGAIVGLGLAWAIVRNINVIHDALSDPPAWLAWTFTGLAAVAMAVTIRRSLSGRLLPLVLGTLIVVVLLVIALGVFVLIAKGGAVIWNPEVYYFSTIPNEVDFGSAAITMVGAVVFSLVGAFIPAAKAADTDPVTALRYE
ncbi:MAG: ABC transporter permease [Phycisphaerales bacterium]|nr:ABC transporter permease [Phycisphaerales bacterium]